MSEPLIVIKPHCPEQEKTRRLEQRLAHALRGRAVAQTVERAADLRPFGRARLLFAVDLGESGVNLEYYQMLKRIRLEPELFVDCLGALVLDGQSELYTKSIARELVFAANRAGCAFVGRPLVEGTATLANFQVQAQVAGTSPADAYQAAVSGLVERLRVQPRLTARPADILALHASSHETSNTYALWRMIKARLTTPQVTEIGLRNGDLVDCSGCPYTTCLHFGEHGGCLYGGVMVDDVFPAVERAEALVILAPNYNDALSANLTAFINRLTALFRRQRFYDKRLYGLIVSGYSGGDIIAEQLIAALCMNKTFYLPPRFCLLETANDAGSLERLRGIEERAAAFAAGLNGAV